MILTGPWSCAKAVSEFFGYTFFLKYKNTREDLYDLNIIKTISEEIKIQGTRSN